MTITVNISYRTSMKIFAQNKARRKFYKCKNRYKNRIESVYLDNSYKNPFDRKMPQSQLETPFSRQG